MSSSPFPFHRSLPAECQDILIHFHSRYRCHSLTDCSELLCSIKSQVCAPPFFFVWPIVTDTYSNAAGSVTSVDLILSPQNRRKKRERTSVKRWQSSFYISKRLIKTNKQKKPQCYFLTRNGYLASVNSVQGLMGWEH